MFGSSHHVIWMYCGLCRDCAITIAFTTQLTPRVTSALQASTITHRYWLILELVTRSHGSNINNRNNNSSGRKLAATVVRTVILILCLIFCVGCALLAFEWIKLRLAQRVVCWILFVDCWLSIVE